MYATGWSLPCLSGCSSAPPRPRVGALAIASFPLLKAFSCASDVAHEFYLRQFELEFVRIKFNVLVVASFHKCD